MDDFRKAMKKEPRKQECACKCCGDWHTGKEKSPFHQRTRTRLKRAIQKDINNNG